MRSGNILRRKNSRIRVKISIKSSHKITATRVVAYEYEDFKNEIGDL